MHELYARVPGDIVLPSDYKHKNALVYSFLVKGTQSKQQDLCNSWLNVRWQQRFRIAPATPYVLISFVNSSCQLGKCVSQDQKEVACMNMGCSRSVMLDHNNREIGFLKFNRVEVSLIVTGLNQEMMLFSPYIFCDDGTVTANYRENFGWNVLLADLDFVASPPDQNCNKFGFTAAIDIPRLELKGSQPPETMLQLIPAEGSTGPLAGQATRFPKEADAIMGMPMLLRQQMAANGADVDASLVFQISQAMMGKMKRISLRQFRGTKTGKKAILQLLQTSQQSNFTYHDGGMIDLGQRFLFPDTSAVANFHFPMRSDFGLPETAEVVAGYWMLCDYQHLPQHVKWSGVKQR